MANRNETSRKIAGWFGDITNLAALLAIAIAVVGLIRNQRLVLLLAFGTLILIVLLRYADVGRFKEVIPSQEGVPPLGLARGSVRAFLAFGLLAGFGLYIYYATTSGQFKTEIFTALSSVISAVVGFYFGSRSTAAAQPAVRPSAPTVSGIEPNKGKAASTGFTANVTGTGFQADATVSLVLDKDTIPAKGVNVVHSTKITCIFDLPPTSKTGKWDVVVTNPDGQTGTLPEGFEIEPAEPAATEPAGDA